MCCMFSFVQLFAIPWTVADQAPLSMEFPRQEYWSGLLFPTPVMYMCVCVCVYNINLYHKYINIIYFDRKGLHGTVD